MSDLNAPGASGIPPVPEVPQVPDVPHVPEVPEVPQIPRGESTVAAAGLPGTQPVASGGDGFAGPPFTDPPTAGPAPGGPASAGPPSPPPGYGYPYPPAPGTQASTRQPLLSILSLVAGVVGLLGLPIAFIPFVGGVLTLLLPAAAIVLGALGRTKEPRARALWLTGLITGIVGVALSLLSIVVWIIVFASMPSTY
ncbi:hypothetical protein [Cryobacterium glucosi]|uniref:hypothetical protein n=1 Tax=Cryobacterium glucosi TaxID=1259175 RepID=UPI00141AE9A3|nr:hypothetical protein [Cryobacterium glucosi]